MSDGGEVRVIGIGGMPEVAPGDDLASLIEDGITAAGERLEPGDIVVVTHKIVSKAEGQIVDLRTITPSPLATDSAGAGKKTRARSRSCCAKRDGSCACRMG